MGLRILSLAQVVIQWVLKRENSGLRVLNYKLVGRSNEGMIEMSGMGKTNVLMGHVVEVVMWVVMRLVGLVGNVVGG